MATKNKWANFPGSMAEKLAAMRKEKTAEQNKIDDAALRMIRIHKTSDAIDNAIWQEIETSKTTPKRLFWNRVLITASNMRKIMTNPKRRKPAKRPRLTPAAIARAHRNPKGEYLEMTPVLQSHLKKLGEQQYRAYWNTPHGQLMTVPMSKEKAEFWAIEKGGYIKPVKVKKLRTNPKRRAPSLPNRGYYILQLDPDIGKHGGLKFGLDHVTPVSWRIWRTSRVLPGYTFKLPESLYNKPAFIEWARKNSGPGFPLYASYAQAKAMVKALM